MADQEHDNQKIEASLHNQQPMQAPVPVSPPTEPEGRALLLEGPVGKMIWKLSWPMGIGFLSIIALNVFAAFYLSRLGEVYIAALGYCFPVVFMQGGFAIGLGTGASSVMSQAIGAGRMNWARRVGGNVLIISTFVSAILGLIMYLSHDFVFTVLRASDETLPLINDYMMIWYMFLPIIIVPMVCISLIRVNGAAKLPSAMMVGEGLLNLVIMPALIFGLLGLPRLEMAGAALASVVARGLIMVIAMYYLVIVSKLIEISRAALMEIWTVAKDVARYAAPAVLAQMMGPISLAVLTRLLGAFGDDVIAGFTIGARIESFMVIPFWAVAFGVIPFIGQNAGAGRMDRLREMASWLWKFCLICGGFNMVVMLLLSTQMSSLFSDDPVIIEYSRQFVQLSAISQIFAAMFVVGQSAMTPMGRPTFTFAMNAFRYVGLFVPFALVLSTPGIFGFGGTYGVFVSSMLAWIISGIVTGFVFHWVIKQDLPAHVVKVKSAT